MAAATDNRGYTGTGSNKTRASALGDQQGPVATNTQLFVGTLAGNLRTDTANPPLLQKYVGDGTMRARGFVTRGANNLTTGGLGETDARATAETGHLIDLNAGGANAITTADIGKAAYGVDNQTCSKLIGDSAGADCIGMIVGIDKDTGNPMILVDPLIAAMLSGSSGAIPPGVLVNVTAVKTAAYTAQFGDLVRCDPTGGAFPVNLPAISSANKGLSIGVKNKSASANPITVTPNGAQTIDGAANFVSQTAREMTIFTSDGVGDWIVE